jgi:hypothetical protein
MRNSENDQASNVTALDVARERRHYIDLANADWDWRQVKASYALEGITLDDRDAERAGRYLAGVMTFDQVKEDILREFGLTNSEAK